MRMRLPSLTRTACERISGKYTYKEVDKEAIALLASACDGTRVSWRKIERLIPQLCAIDAPDTRTCIRYITAGMPIYRWILVWDDGEEHSCYFNPDDARRAAYFYNKHTPRSGRLRVRLLTICQS